MSMNPSCQECGEEDAEIVLCAKHYSAERDALKARVAELDRIREGMGEQFLLWRGIEPENACVRCGGSGTRAYGSTATWRGGIGGQAITSDVCDSCWGSGDAKRPGFNLRGHSPQVAQAVAAEREACAEVADRFAAGVFVDGTLIAADIRARGGQ